MLRGLIDKTKSYTKILPLFQIPSRNIVLHEFQSAHVLHQYDIPFPRGNIAFNHKEAFTIARKFGSEYRGKFVLKA